MKSALRATDQTPPPLSLPGFPWDTYAVWAMALTVILSAVVWAFLCDRPQEFDDIGLFNVPYMYAHYRVLTYPAHGEFHTLIVHPPIHYWILGILMRWGIPPFYAEAIPLLLLILLGVALAIGSEFPTVVSAGLLLGICTPLLFARFIPTMRPDIHRGLALFTGLVALESGRLRDWNARRLFLGSFLITYASVLHYPGFTGFLGVFVYIGWVLFDMPKERWAKPILALVGGGCVIGVPYLAFFLIPHRREIVAAIGSVEPFGGVLSSVRVHVLAYQNWWNPAAGKGLAINSAITLLFYPVVLGIPLVLLGAAALFSFRSTRGIACAGLPYPLCLLLLMTHKIYWSGYFLPEFMLYGAGVGVVLSAGLYHLCLRLSRTRRSASLIWGSLCLIGMLGLLTTSPVLRGATFSLRERVHETEIARAAARTVMGSNALIGTRNAIMFYASGAAYYYDVSPDVLWTRNPPADLRAYFRVFDAVIEHQTFSSSTENTAHKSLISWYADGILKLHGFYFSSQSPALRYLVLNTNPAARVTGFATLSSGQVVSLEEQDGGQYAFVTAVCPPKSEPSVKSIFSNSYLMPAPADAFSQQQELSTWLVDKREYVASRPEVSHNCRVIDDVSADMQAVDTGQLLATLQHDQPIRFFEHLDDALRARYGAPVEFKLAPDGWPDGASFRYGQHEGENYPLSPQGQDVLFSSAINSTDGWQINRYGKGGGLKIVADGLSAGERSGRYASADSRDHLSSPFVVEPLASGLLFFTLWAKPVGKSSPPTLYLQNTNYVTLGTASAAVTRSDGWVLLAGWAEAPRQEQVRLVLAEKPGEATLVEKALVMESAAHLPGHPAAGKP